VNAPLRGSRAGRRHPLVTLAVVLALLAPMLSPIGGADLWGWLPDHGHASLDGALAPHSHPWDVQARGAAPSDTSPLVFTAGDLMGGAALPAGLAVLVLIPVLVPLARPVAQRMPVRSEPWIPEPPPPR